MQALSFFFAGFSPINKIKVEIKRAEPKKPERQPRPIILPVPAYFSPTGYTYPMAYASASGAYGQATLAYDSTGQYIVAPYVFLRRKETKK